jgi:hypothetical protein
MRRPWLALGCFARERERERERERNGEKDKIVANVKVSMCLIKQLLCVEAWLYELLT